VLDSSNVERRCFDDSTRVPIFIEWLNSSHNEWLANRVAVIITKSPRVLLANCLRIQSVGVDSARFHLSFQNRIRSQIFLKNCTWFWSHFSFSVAAVSLHGLYKRHWLITNVVQVRWHWWLEEFKQDSDSHIWKTFSKKEPDPDSKILEQERSRCLKIWFQQPLWQSLIVCTLRTEIFLPRWLLHQCNPSDSVARSSCVH